MKYLVTAAEMKKYDNNTSEQIGIPGMVLMERAALAAFEVIQKAFEQRADQGKKVFILAGVGNNGGDGLALGRLLAESGYRVTIQVVGQEEKASEQWRIQRKIISHYPVTFSSKATGEEYNIIIDALFGVGLSRTVTGVYGEAIEALNAASGWKLALDMPSGVNADNGQICGCAVQADV
ncbi:MAG: NAD(P)H-hydrate epimerase, partial [Lachnospiraceae bacterium]|nr:NAD(P)H-hydrate epimerase [Lachnospiraceae bacterium]